MANLSILPIYFYKGQWSFKWLQNIKCCLDFTANLSLNNNAKFAVNLSSNSAHYAKFVVNLVSICPQTVLRKTCANLLPSFVTKALHAKYKLTADTGGTRFLTKLWASLIPNWHPIVSKLLTGQKFQENMLRINNTSCWQ